MLNTATFLTRLDIHTYIIQDVSGGKVNILGGVSMDYSE